jgi:beta-N-acetylhexosaminidase
VTPRTAAALAILLGVAACRPSPRVAPPPVPSPSPLSSRWARETASHLTLEEKAAQLVGVRVFGLYRNPRSADVVRLLDQIRRLKVGTVVVFDSEIESVPRVLNDLQAASALPLLVAADLERGLSQRIRRGVVPLPDAMALGATRSEEAARFAGEVTAREARAVGIHWAFAPVADVNSNPANPIVNVRSFGEDPELVAKLTAAFIQGARAGGVLTTAKHFPGHGDTSVDSHLQLATLTADIERLRAVELLPFERDVRAGVDAVMLGHIAAPALDPTGTPASLSAPMVRVLREEMGFTGLVVTDAMEMQGVRAAWTGEAAVRAIQAGADVILLPPDPEVAVKALVGAVKEGQLSEERIDASLRRILEAKERLGLDKNRRVDVTALGKSVDRPEDVERSLEVARQSITVVRNGGGVLPLEPEGPLRILHLVLSSDARNDAIQGFPEDELATRRIRADTINLGPEVSQETEDRLVADAAGYTHVLASCFVRVRAHKGSVEMSESHVRLLRALRLTGRPVIVVSFGSPYLLRQVPDTAVYVCAYSASESSQRAAVQGLLGEYAVAGTLPVTIPGLYPMGHGLQMPRREMTLRMDKDGDSPGFRREGLAELDHVVERFVESKAFPGAVLAVGKDGHLAHLRAFGHLTYEPAAPGTRADTIYDLASLTKVIATTTMAMILVDEGKLDIQKPVSAFLPGFKGGAKDKVTVWHLLTHSSGLDWWGPLYKELHGKDAYLQRIQAMDLVYEPGSKSLYSDLGAVLLGEVLERVAGEPVDVFARRRIFDPLGMKDTLFRPGSDLRARVAPTEVDPWRGRLLQGEVHDENAFALGGVAPHAGLFGTAPDLARFAQMLLNGGVYEHRRIVSAETVERFTRRAGVPESSRALGWDTPSAGSSSGSLFSPRSFGHTGFTGTSLWIDPEKRLFLILLTNRVHPTRENDGIRKARPAIADAVVNALAP